MLHKPHGFIGLPRQFPLFLYDSVYYIWWQTKKKKVEIRHVRTLFLFKPSMCFSVDVDRREYPSHCNKVREKTVETACSSS